MKALTINEPYASLIMAGIKQLETRTCKTKHRGKLANHAGKTRMDERGESLARRYGITPKYGMVLGIVDLVECWECIDNDRIFRYNEKMAKDGTLDEYLDSVQMGLIEDDFGAEEKAFGYFDTGGYAWELEVIEKFENPIPAKGQQRLWDWER